MSACDACQKAELNARTGWYSNGCIECQARALAQEPSHFEAYVAQRYTPNYLARLNKVFGDDWEAGHKQVKRWSQRIKEANAK